MMPPGVPTTLYRKLVALTEGVVKPRKLIWKGRIRNAPVMPAMEEKKEITNAMRGGIKIDVSTPETGKRIRKLSIFFQGVCVIRKNTYKKLLFFQMF
jgi:hypothetical protein